MPKRLAMAVTADETAIEKMRPDDVDAVYAIECDVFPDPWEKSAFEEEARRRDAMAFPLVARRRGAVVGYMIAWFVHDEVHLANIAVESTEQHRGVAQRMLERLLAEGDLRRSAYVTLEVRFSNERAIRLYRRNGFREVAIRKGYYRNGEDALVMMRPFTAPAPD
jgi:ribosomal-protein-alanine N-acetyltransferase